MRSYLTRARLLAGVLLLAFLGQGAWLVHREVGGEALEAEEATRIGEGWKQWHGRGLAGAPFGDLASAAVANLYGSHEWGDESGFEREHSPFLYLVSAAPLLPWPSDFDSASSRYWRWLPRLPFLACGLFLGASLWYVARRLCGTPGGVIALTLYCFSPLLIQTSAGWHVEPQIFPAWGAFGTVFTAIAVAHTLYAPREVIVWNWRRTVLLGISLAIAIAAQFSMIVVVPIALAFLLYVAPVRRGAATVIWIAGCLIGFVLLFGMYFFHPHGFLQAMKHAEFWGATWRGFTVPGVYKQVGVQLGRACPALALALPFALVTYALWPRTRYFGNTAPLLVAVIFLLLGMMHTDRSGAGFLIAAVPFLFLFVSGVLADCLETEYRSLVMACVAGLLGAYVLWSVVALVNVPKG
ncbi:MAG TPA: hypothetical protein VMX38_18860 [Verrucomicrobiae bacterium]|nr:hypothetical protein [Verrucomicrobiae bacterium]